MKQHDAIDVFLRELLVDWTLEEVAHPIKRATLQALSLPNWIDHLYAVEGTEIAKDNEKQKEEKVVKKCRTEEVGVRLFHLSEEEEKKIVQHMYEALKKEYEEGFFIKRWGLKKEEGSAFYHMGPMNATGTIFFKIRVGFVRGILCWDLEDKRGKVKSEGYEEIPQILAKSLRTLGYDVLVRKLAKNGGKIIYTGKKSASLLFLLQETKDMNVMIKGDEEGNLWLKKGRKKEFLLVPDLSSSVPNWQVLNENMTEKKASFATKEALNNFLESFSPKEMTQEQEN